MEPGVCAPCCSKETFLKEHAFVTLDKLRYFLKGMDFTFGENKNSAEAL